MNTREMELLNLEEELLNTRRKLNHLIQEYHIGAQSPEGQPSQELERDALYQNQIHQMEKEVQYLHRQMQLMKLMQPAAEERSLQVKAPKPQEQQNTQTIHMPQVLQDRQTLQGPQAFQNMQPQPTPQKPSRKPQEYEKLFGKNFMGIFASVLIFISLIIFATLVVPYLNDTMKLIGLYVISFGILGVGFSLYHKNNKFYIAVIGCGTGALYLSLLLSNLYFDMLGDIALYCLILLWAVLVKHLTKLKHLVFQIIGQSGIFIATILGTVLCVSEEDETKFFVLTVFYLLAAFVLSETDKSYWKHLTSRKDGDVGQASAQAPCYESRFCSHLSKSLNVGVFLVGFEAMETSGFKIAGVLLLLGYLLVEYYLAFRETCRHGFAFQLLTVANAFLVVGLFYELALVSENDFGIVVYLAAIATLLYAEKKNAPFEKFTLFWCAVFIFVGCCSQDWIREHLYVYLTVIPFLLYGKWKNRSVYRNLGVLYLGGFWILMLLTYDYSGYRSLECFFMIAAVCAAFLYMCHKADYVGEKITGYLLLCLTVIEFVNDVAYTLMIDYNALHAHGIADIYSKANSLAFFTVALMHLWLSKLEFFGTKKPVEWMMFAVNALLMYAGCMFMHDMSWQIPTILITVLLFLVNSQRLLSRHQWAGYYVAFKYTVLMISILSSFSVENYIVSICLLLFAIASIVAGFYKNTAAFRLYGLILSMISVIKLVLIDLHYDSTLENALSFFVCGVLCFIISFIYHKIDAGFKNKGD